MSEREGGVVLPLTGRRVLVTRAPHQASELVERLVQLGATPVLVPTIEIGPPSSYAALDEAIRSVAGSGNDRPSFDLVAFTSANAVSAFVQRAELLGVQPDLRRVAAVGPATARALESAGMRCDVLPPVFTAESLAETLRPDVRGRKVLLVLVEGGPKTLEDGLVAGGAKVTVAAAYANRIPASSLAAVKELFAEPGRYPDAVTLTSASTAANLMALLDAAGLKLPAKVVRASIGPITSRALQDLGMAADVEAAESTIPALVEALAAYFRGKG